MVCHPSEYLWSSHGHYGNGGANSLITEHPEYQRLGMNVHERRAAFWSLCGEPLDQRDVERIRTAINTESALGSEQFMRLTEERLGRSVRVPTRGRPVKAVTEKLF
jgi:hypothetical protein